MKIVGTYNKIPEALKPKPLAKGQTALYRLLNSKPDPNDPLKKKIIWPVRMKIPTLDVIRNPDTGEPIEVGVVDSVDRDNRPTIKTFWVTGQENNGYFTLIGANRHDDYLHWYFELSNYNNSNPNRDPSIEPLFERVDRVEIAKKALHTLDEKLEALIYVRDMKAQELKTLAAAMSWDEHEDTNILRNKAKELAESDHKKFAKMIRSKDIEIKATAKRAHDAGVIKYSVQQHKVLWSSSGDTIATLSRVEGQDWLTGFADWIITSKNGEKTLEAIRKLVNKEVEQAA